MRTLGLATQPTALEAVAKYVAIDVEQVHLQREGNCETLELNISLPEPTSATPNPSMGHSATN